MLPMLLLLPLVCANRARERTVRELGKSERIKGLPTTCRAPLYWPFAASSPAEPLDSPGATRPLHRIANKVEKKKEGQREEEQEEQEEQVEDGKGGSV